MVSTRTGKTTYSAEGEVEQQQGARGKRSSGKENSASVQRASARPSTSTRRTKAAAAEDAAANEAEPTTPTSDKRTSKRTRAAGAAPLSPLGEEDVRSPDVATHDQSQLHAAANAPLPDGSPSPLPKKPRTVAGEVHEAGTSQQQHKRRAARKPTHAAAQPNISKHWLVWAVPVLLLALLGAALLSPDLRQHAHQRAEVVHGLLTEYIRQAQSLASTHAHALQALAAIRAKQLEQATAPLLARAKAHGQHAADAARSALAAAQSHAAALLGSSSQGQEAGGTSTPSAAPARAGGVSASQWAALLPAGAAWEDVAADMAEKVNSQGPERNKGVGVLLACSASADCTAAAAALKAAGSPCALNVDGSSMDTAGELQAQLAPFLAGCPTGLVVVQQAHLLPLAAVPALNNALSELGGFQHGGEVDATKATYVLLLEVAQAEEAAAAGGSDGGGQGVAAAEQHVKAAFFDGLEQQAAEAGAADVDDVMAAARKDTEQLLRALRRRVEFAAPVREGAASPVVAAATAA